MRCALLTILFAWLAAHAVCNSLSELLLLRESSLLISNSTSLMAVPFGILDDIEFSEPSLVPTADSNFDISNLASDDQWDRYKYKDA